MTRNFLMSSPLSFVLLLSSLVLSGCSGSNGSTTPAGDQPNVTGDSSGSIGEGATDTNSTSDSTGDPSGSTDSGNSSSGNNSLNDNPATGEQEPNTTTPTVPVTTRVNFDITVPVYVSTSLQVRVTWGDKSLVARWVTDESWAISDDFPIDTEHNVVVTFSDGNGALTLGKFEQPFKTGSNDAEVFTVTADQFETNQFDDDGDGISNLAESIAGTNPIVEDILEPVMASIDLVADKTFRINWQATTGAQYYRVLENPDGLSGYTQISEDLDSSTLVFDHRVALFKRVNARYIVQVCNAVECVDSEELTISGSLSTAIGYFKASNSDENDNFGESVALNADGTVLAVGTYLEDSAATGINGDQDNNSAIDTGAVYVFKRSNDRWQQQAYIKASNSGFDDLYGFAISLNADGNTLAVGARDEDSAAAGINGIQGDNTATDSGAVYVYVNTNGVWQQQAYIKASNTNAFDTFGNKVSLSGDGNTLVVSADGEDSSATGINGDESDNSADGSGAVYVFSRIDGNWQQQAYLKASNAEAKDEFGSAIGLSEDGNTLAVGASRESSAATGINGNQSNNNAGGAGAVYLFERVDGNWQQKTYVKASNTDGRDIFGVRLSLSADGETLAVAAYGEQSAAAGIDGNQNDDSYFNAGAVYVFGKSTGAWQQEAYVKSSNTEQNDFFGISVSLSGDGNTMVVGAFFEDSAAQGIGGNQFDNASDSSGAAYVFERKNGVWRQQAYLKASNNSFGSWFGFATSLSTDGETLAIGARYEGNNATGINGNQNGGSLRDSGSVYLY